MMRNVTVAPLGSSGLRSLIVTPESSHDTAPALHKEELRFEHVKLAQRSYK